MDPSITVNSVTNPDISHKKLKSLCVTQRNNKFYYPKSIPKERGPLATQIFVTIVLALFMTDMCTTENKPTDILYLYTSGLLYLILVQVLHRIILMVEEYNHIISRYEGNFSVLAKDALFFRPYVYIASIICLIYCVYYWCSHGILYHNAASLRLVLYVVPSIYFMGVVLRLSSCPLNDSLWVAEDNGLDYGSGMAYSFFHGYLNIVLPKTGTEERNLKELMQLYEDKNNITFSAYKLFILIPKSLKCFVSLKNEYSPSIDESSSLPEKIITVAGVQDRVYKNAVYKIKSEKNTKIYVSAEYATPLKTFKDVFDTTGDHSGEVIKYSPEDANIDSETLVEFFKNRFSTVVKLVLIVARDLARAFYEKHKKDIILQFYLTLKKVLEKTGLNAFCELIYFEDSYQDQDGKTCYYDVGKILLTRLKKNREKNE